MICFCCFSLYQSASHPVALGLGHVASWQGMWYKGSIYTIAAIHERKGERGERERERERGKDGQAPTIP
jgi:hypothetical protein